MKIVMTKEDLMNLYSSSLSCSKLHGVHFSCGIVLAQGEMESGNKIKAIEKSIEMSEEYQLYHNKKIEYHNSFLHKDDKGNPITGSYIENINLVRDKIIKFDKDYSNEISLRKLQREEYKSLLKESVEIGIELIDISVVPKNITVGQLFGIYKLIDNPVTNLEKVIVSNKSIINFALQLKLLFDLTGKDILPSIVYNLSVIQSELDIIVATDLYKSYALYEKDRIELCKLHSLKDAYNKPIMIKDNSQYMIDNQFAFDTALLNLIKKYKAVITDYEEIVNKDTELSLVFIKREDIVKSFPDITPEQYKSISFFVR